MFRFWVVKKMFSVFKAPAPNCPITAKTSNATRNLLRPKKRRPATDSASTPEPPDFAGVSCSPPPSAGGAPSTATALEDESFWRGAFVGSGMRTERIARYDTR